jgi:hypothetical protein
MDLLGSSCYETDHSDSDTEQTNCRTTTTASGGRHESGRNRELMKTGGCDQQGQVTLVSAGSNQQQQHTDRSTAAVSPAAFTRSQPHIRGNWAGHVFIHVHANTSNCKARPSVQKINHASSLRSLSDQAVHQWKDKLETANGFVTDGGVLAVHELIHISLSRTLYLQQGNIASFIQQLSERLQFVEPGWVALANSTNKILVNDDRTRSFLTWPVQTTRPVLFLETLVEHVNAVLTRYQQPTYYDPPLFHVSLASIPGVVVLDSTATTTTTNRLNDPKMRTGISSDGSSPRQRTTILHHFYVKEIHCTFGSTHSFSIPLWDRSRSTNCNSNQLLSEDDSSSLELSEASEE